MASVFFFGLLNTKGIKLGISPTDTKFKHIYMDTSHIYIEINDTYYWSQELGSLMTKDEAVSFSKMNFGMF